MYQCINTTSCIFIDEYSQQIKECCNLANNKTCFDLNHTSRNEMCTGYIHPPITTHAWLIFSLILIVPCSAYLLFQLLRWCADHYSYPNSYLPIIVPISPIVLPYFEDDNDEYNPLQQQDARLQFDSDNEMIL